MASRIATLAALAMALTTAAAAPMAERAARHSGTVTWFKPGLGACGETNGDDDAIVAVPSAVFDKDSSCNRSIRVSRGDSSVEVRVVDRCAGCGADGLDLSPSAFKQLVGSTDPGSVTASWEWA